MRIYLTGFMGSGKSTIGTRLARMLAVPFMDTDAWIEEAVGLRIPDYFARAGEAAFRYREAAALRATARHRHSVVATGGGMLVHPRRMQEAQQLGAVVYLRVDPDTLYERLAPDAAHRPLLCDASGQPLSGQALQTHIAALLDRRRAAYEQAPFHVDAGAAPNTVSQRIRTCLAV